MKKIFTSGIIFMFLALAFSVGPTVPQTPTSPATQQPLLKGQQGISEPIIFTNGKFFEIRGRITDIIYGNGMRPVQITVRASNGSLIPVELGPIWIFNATQLFLGNSIKVKGVVEGSYVIAYSVVFGKDQLVQLRDYTGYPIWQEGQRNEMPVQNIVKPTAPEIPINPQPPQTNP